MRFTATIISEIDHIIVKLRIRGRENSARERSNEQHLGSKRAEKGRFSVAGSRIQAWSQPKEAAHASVLTIELRKAVAVMRSERRGRKRAGKAWRRSQRAVDSPPCCHGGGRCTDVLFEAWEWRVCLQNPFRLHANGLLSASNSDNLRASKVSDARVEG
jgi:hypothetical protein